MPGTNSDVGGFRYPSQQQSFVKKIDELWMKKKNRFLKAPHLAVGIKFRPVRGKTCFHCKEQFHSKFCRALSLRNRLQQQRQRSNHVDQNIQKKYECVVCQKSFTEIHDFLLHRTLHNETDETQTDQEPSGNSEFKSLGLGLSVRGETSLSRDDKQTAKTDLRPTEWEGRGAVMSPEIANMATGAKKRKGKPRCKTCFLMLKYIGLGLFIEFQVNVLNHIMHLWASLTRLIEQDWPRPS